MNKVFAISAVLFGAVAGFSASANAQEPNPLPQKFNTIYPAPGQARNDVQKAMEFAAQQHKRLLLDFGTDRCAECQVLSGFWATDTNRAQVADRFLLVHVNVGAKGDQNRALAQRFHVDPKAGLPIVVVADGDGKVLNVSKEFLRAHNESAEDLTGFLNKAR